jgi:pyrroline-5-carboxylate reductase
MPAKITFIGAGNMANSLAGGLIAKGYDASCITMSDVRDQQLQIVRSQLLVQTNRDNLTASRKADVIVLAVKPDAMSGVVAGLKTLILERKPLVISIAAGIPLNQLETWLGSEVALVRAMPNTPALVGAGATGLYANAAVSEMQKDLAKSILSAVGLALWVESDDQIDAVTAVSGSGPAYFFLVMEAMIEAGTQLGLPASITRQLVLQTALGSAQMAITSSGDPAQLRRQVTSPGGTTERAVGILQAKGLQEAFQAALEGACHRSKELAAMSRSA